VIKHFFLLIAGVFLTFQSETFFRNDLPAKKWKVFDHPEFSFRYPSNWKKFIVKDLDQSAIVRIAPKKELKSVYLKTYDSLLYSSEVNYMELNKLPVNKESRQLITIPGRKYIKTLFSETQFKISVHKLKTESLDFFIAARKEQIAARDDYSGFFKRIDKDHYAHYLRVTFVDEGLNTQDVTMHFYNRNGTLFVLTFLTKQDKKDKYQEVADKIFSSFKFKD
jgi:hypothetical protein